MKKFTAVLLMVVFLVSMIPCLSVGAETVSKTVPVVVKGMHDGYNHWEDATYTYDVVGGEPNDWGYLSNGVYKFRYEPANGWIAPSTSAEIVDSFAYETDVVPADVEFIVIPTHIGAYNDENINCNEKDIVLHSKNNSGAGIFRGHGPTLNNGHKIVIPEGVTTIPKYTLSRIDGNYKFSFILPSTLKTIEENAFFAGTSGGYYYEIVIPDSVTTIGQKAFTQNRFTGVFTIPASVTTIGARAFASVHFHSIIFKGDVTTWGVRPFETAQLGNAIILEGDSAPTFSSKNDKIKSLDTVYCRPDATGYTVDYKTNAYLAGTKFAPLTKAAVINEIVATDSGYAVSYLAGLGWDNSTNKAVEGDSVCVIALYNGKELVLAETVDKSGLATFETDQEITEARIFLWGDLVNVKPLCSSDPYSYSPAE